MLRRLHIPTQKDMSLFRNGRLYVPSRTVQINATRCVMIPGGTMVWKADNGDGCAVGPCATTTVWSVDNDGGPRSALEGAINGLLLRHGHSVYSGDPDGALSAQVKSEVVRIIRKHGLVRSWTI